MIICYTVTQIQHVTDVIFTFIFGLFFCLFISPPLKNLKNKMSKKWTNTWWYHHFRNTYQKLWSYNVQFLKYGAQGMKGQTDGQTEKGHIEFGAPHNKSCNNRNYFRALQSPISSGKYSILNWALKLILSKKNSCKN